MSPGGTTLPVYRKPTFPLTGSVAARVVAPGQGWLAPPEEVVSDLPGTHPGGVRGGDPDRHDRTWAPVRS